MELSGLGLSMDSQAMDSSAQSAGSYHQVHSCIPMSAPIQACASGSGLVEMRCRSAEDLWLDEARKDSVDRRGCDSSAERFIGKTIQEDSLGNNP